MVESTLLLADIIQLMLSRVPQPKQLCYVCSRCISVFSHPLSLRGLGPL